MKDIFDTKVLCKDCNVQTRKIYVVKDGFKMRALECPNCGQRWYHPVDLEKYQQFKKLKNKRFHVKLRIVGNSFCVSIPKEIIEFQNMEQEIDRMVSLFIKDQERIILEFKKKMQELMR